MNNSSFGDFAESSLDLEPATVAGPRHHTPSRQSLFPVPTTQSVPKDAVTYAERALGELGFIVEAAPEDAWHISWPGSPLRIWRHSDAELYLFARDLAHYYADHAKLQHLGSRH